MPSTGKVIGYTALGMVIGAASVATCGAVGAGVAASCAGWGGASAAMPAVIGGGAVTGGAAGGAIGYDAARNSKKKK